MVFLLSSKIFLTGIFLYMCDLNIMIRSQPERVEKMNCISNLVRENAA